MNRSILEVACMSAGFAAAAALWLGTGPGPSVLRLAALLASAAGVTQLVLLFPVRTPIARAHPGVVGAPWVLAVLIGLMGQRAASAPDSLELISEVAAALLLLAAVTAGPALLHAAWVAYDPRIARAGYMALAGLVSSGMGMVMSSWGVPGGGALICGLPLALAIDATLHAWNRVTSRAAASAGVLFGPANPFGIEDLARSLQHAMLKPLGCTIHDLEVARMRCDAPEVPGLLAGASDRLKLIQSQVHELLHLGRARKLGMVREIPVAVLVEQAVCEVLRTYPDAKISAAGIPGVARGDEVALRSALASLVENAVEASRPGDPIEVTGAWHKEMVHVSVRDRGEGFPASLGVEVFEPFVTNKQRGTGLGLAIANQVAVCHGGSLSVRRLPVGSEVTLHLPGRRGAEPRLLS